MKTIKITRTTEEPKLVIQYDPGATSPREDSNLGYFITKDSSYSSPDKHEELESIIASTGDEAQNQDDHMKRIMDEFNQALPQDEKILAIYPVCKYEHGDVNYSLGTSHGFDYSNNGFYIITDKTQKEIGATKKDWERIIESEIKIYNKWVNGEVYSFTYYYNDGEAEESCGGFYDIEDIREYLPTSWKTED